jgi:hypothetical protein
MARMTLDQLVAQLRQMHGDKLRCVLLYGSAAVGEAIEQRSDLNVLVLVDRIDPAQLEALGATARGWSEAGNPPPLELTVDEWQRSADIFPMEYADILERHKVLHGALPAEMRVSRRDLRRQAEFEAMGKVLRLRQGIMRAGTDAAQQLDLLKASHSTLMVIFRAAVRAAGERAPADRGTLIARVAELSGLDPAPFVRVHALLRGGDAKGREAEQLLFGTLAGMERLTAWLDTYDPGEGA